MQGRIVAIFCYIDDFLKVLSWKDNSQLRGNNASKKLCFTGLKVHVIAMFQGESKEFAI